MLSQYTVTCCECSEHCAAAAVCWCVPRSAQHTSSNLWDRGVRLVAFTGPPGVRQSLLFSPHVLVDVCSV